MNPSFSPFTERRSKSLFRSLFRKLHLPRFLSCGSRKKHRYASFPVVHTRNTAASLLVQATKATAASFLVQATTSPVIFLAKLSFLLNFALKIPSQAIFPPKLSLLLKNLLKILASTIIRAKPTFPLKNLPKIYAPAIFPVELIWFKN
ncbi:hypothetical protein AMTR_s00052p00082960 [Amborella trichopoda]|uniref:Uncharacterized protein n=1 Tax=Amborella trichopoda TaxID=13333 RepID=U5CSY7_AMBTC|nr:hypothetical protein AMTR_s00052p00082960 [Amborella trichopoda]